MATEFDKILREGEIAKQLLEKGYVETKLSKIGADLIGKKVCFKALIVGENVGKAFEKKIAIKCSECGKMLGVIDLLEEKNFQILYEKLASNRLSSINIKEFVEGECEKSENKKHDPFIEVLPEYSDYSIVFVRELPEQIEALTEKEYQSLASKIWRVYYPQIPPNARKVRIKGFVMKNRSTNELEFLAYEIEPIEEEIETIKITREDHELFQKYFADESLFSEIVKNQIAPHIVGRDDEKLSALLLLHSPCQIFDIFNSRLIRGSLRVAWVGDTKTGKSEIGKDLTYQFFKIGEIVFVETSSRAGLIYTIDTDARVIIWGAVVLNDKKFVFLDGVHLLQPEEIAQMREVLEQQRVKVSRSVSGERFARTRIIATLNPRKPMDSYYYKVQALMDTNFFRDPADLTRWDIVLPFCDEDVKAEEIAEARPKERPIPTEIFKKHILWVWSLTPTQIKYSEDAKEKIITFTKNLLSNFHASDYPLIHNGVRDTLTRLSVAFACLHHSVIFSEDGSFQFVEVNTKHVEEAKAFIDKMIKRLNYDSFVARKKEETELSEEEFEAIVSELDIVETEILRGLDSGPKSSPQLASILGISERSVKEHYEKLRRFRLIMTSHGFGVALTSKGIKFLKKLDSHQNVKIGQKNAINQLSLAKTSENTSLEGGYCSGSGEVVKSSEVKSGEIGSPHFTTSPLPPHTPLPSEEAKEIGHESAQIGAETPSAPSALSAKDSDISRFKVELDEVHEQLMKDPEYYCLFWLLIHMQQKMKFGFGPSLNKIFRLGQTKCKARAKVIFEEKYKDLIEKPPEEVIPILYQKLKERREAFIKREFRIAPDADEPVDVKEIDQEPKQQPKKEKKEVNPLDKIVRQKDPGYYSRLEKDFIEVVKHPPLGKQIFDFEVETFLVQRGYEVEDIRKVAEKLIEAGVIIRFPDGKLDLNFSRLGG